MCVSSSACERVARVSTVDRGLFGSISPLSRVGAPQASPLASVRAHSACLPRACSRRVHAAYVLLRHTSKVPRRTRPRRPKHDQDHCFCQRNSLLSSKFIRDNEFHRLPRTAWCKGRSTGCCDDDGAHTSSQPSYPDDTRAREQSTTQPTSYLDAAASGRASVRGS